MFLSLHMIFSLERAAAVWAILERISGFDPSLEMIAPRYLKFFTSSSLWPFILISLWKPFGLFVITFVLSGPISILYLVVVLSRRSNRTPASSFTTMSSAKRKLVMSRPPMLILSRKMLKRVCETRHPCRTPTVVLNHSLVLPLNRTALWTLSYRFSMARMMLAMMLYVLIVAHKALCHTHKAYFLWTSDYTLSFRVHVSSSDHSDFSSVYPFMSFLYGLGTSTTNLFREVWARCPSTFSSIAIELNFKTDTKIYLSHRHQWTVYNIYLSICDRTKSWRTTRP